MRPLAFASVTDGNHLAFPKRRWRVGKMDAELAGMRERLASLQALYQQQMLRRQLSPRRGRSCGNTDDHMQLAAQQAVAAEAREAKQGRFATDGGAAAGKGLQEGKTAGCSASDNTTAADSSSSIVPGLDDSKGQQGEAAAVPRHYLYVHTQASTALLVLHVVP